MSLHPAAKSAQNVSSAEPQLDLQEPNKHIQDMFVGFLQAVGVGRRYRFCADLAAGCSDVGPCRFSRFGLLKRDRIFRLASTLAQGQQVHGQQAQGQQAHGQRAEGQQAQGQLMQGQRVEGQQAPQ